MKRAQKTAESERVRHFRILRLSAFLSLGLTVLLFLLDGTQSHARLLAALSLFVSAPLLIALASMHCPYCGLRFYWFSGRTLKLSLRCQHCRRIV